MLEIMAATGLIVLCLFGYGWMVVKALKEPNDDEPGARTSALRLLREVA